MTHYRSNFFEGKEIRYYIFYCENEYGIYITYDKTYCNIPCISTDKNFVLQLLDKMCDSYTLPDYAQEICEDAVFEQSFVKYIGRNDEF